MTIKRRLFWSNVLMLIIPILLSLLLSAIVINLVLDQLGVGNVSPVDSNLFYRVAQRLQQTEAKGESLGSAEQILADMESLGIPSQSGAVTLAIYTDDKYIASLGEFPSESTLLCTAMEQPENRHFTVDYTALYSTSDGPYRIYLINTAHEYGEMGRVDGDDSDFPVAITILAIVFTAILITNRLLTHFVFKSISTPLDILVDGVHEIRDGNLSHRIVYGGRDEFAGVCADFNEMARQLQELMAAKQAAEQNRRELIAGIAHDLRTPLTSIKAYVEGLQAGVAETPADQKEYLDTIAGKTEDLVHIIEQLFQFSKLDAGDFPISLKPVDIGEYLTSYTKSIESEYAGKGLEIRLDAVTEGVIVRIDPAQLRSVFTNLVENSLKYASRDGAKLEVECADEEGTVHIRFTDNGPGVPQEQLDKLFSAFYRSDKARRNPGQGSGLGLAISARIIERLGGGIYAENCMAGGLRVTVTLPIISGGGIEG